MHLWTEDNMQFDILQDNGNDWKLKKQLSEHLSELYNLSGFEIKSRKINDCGTYLEFKRFVASSELKLKKANFCKARLCPVCAWRRSKKIFAQISQCMDWIQAKEEKYRFIFLTLTIKNCCANELATMLDKLSYGFKRLTKKTAFKSINGYFRAFEVTYNQKNGYHPHIHTILAVKPGYFTNTSAYITHSDWVQMWSDVMELDYRPSVDVRVVKKKVDRSDQLGSVSYAGSVAEVAKYTVKTSDWVKIKDKTKAADVIKALDVALMHRKLIGFGGLFLEAKRSLNLSDSEDNLIEISGEEQINPDLAYVIERYRWFSGLGNYYRMD